MESSFQTSTMANLADNRSMLMTNTTSTDEMSEMDGGGISPLSIVITLFIIGVCLFACVGNFTVFLAICRTPELHTHTNAFVANLAVADFCIGLQTLIVRSFFEFKSEWLNYYVACNFRYFASTTMTCASGLLLCGVAVVRFVAIMKPLRYEELVTSKRTVTAIVIIWAYSSLISMPILVPGYLKWKPGIICDAMIVFPESLVHNISVHVFVFLIVLIISYTYISVAIHKQLRRIGTGGDPLAVATNMSEFKRKIKSIKAFVIVVGIFVLAYAPFTFLLEMPYLGFDIYNNMGISVFAKICLILLLVNNASNPVIYALCMEVFRKPMKAILCFCRKPNDIAPADLP